MHWANGSPAYLQFSFQAHHYIQGCVNSCTVHFQKFSNILLVMTTTIHINKFLFLFKEFRNILKRKGSMHDVYNPSEHNFFMETNSTTKFWIMPLPIVFLHSKCTWMCVCVNQIEKVPGRPQRIITIRLGQAFFLSGQAIYIKQMNRKATWKASKNYHNMIRPSNSTWLLKQVGSINKTRLLWG